MQKFVSILFLIIYFNTAMVVGVDVHFCGGHVADVKLAGFGHAECNCPKGSMPEGCCKSELHFFKTDNHKNLVAVTVVVPEMFIKTPVILPDFISPLPLVDFTKISDVICDHPRSKYKPACPLFILNSVYRI